MKKKTLKGHKDKEFISEDNMVMICGHKGRKWSSLWKICLECHPIKSKDLYHVAL